MKVSDSEYEEYFKIGSKLEVDRKLNRSAFEIALDNRKFEIELYWKRANHFWIFIIAMYSVITFSLVNQNIVENVSKYLIPFAFSIPLVLITFIWILVNFGSKHWQENWESHVDCLEDNICGPLYKIVYKKYDLIFSVSRLNIIISIIICAFSVIISYALMILLITYENRHLIIISILFVLIYIMLFIIIVLLSKSRIACTNEKEWIMRN